MLKMATRVSNMQICYSYSHTTMKLHLMANYMQRYMKEKIHDNCFRRYRLQYTSLLRILQKVGMEQLHH